MVRKTGRGMVDMTWENCLVSQSLDVVMSTPLLPLVFRYEIEVTREFKDMAFGLQLRMYLAMQFAIS